MFFPHRNSKLQELFSHKPYQGADPATAQFLFFGLDANYDPNIGNMRCLSEIIAYLEDGVGYWKQKGYHHPFLTPDYKGDGALYHSRFAKIGFTPDHAERVSFVELIDVPTSGRSNLLPNNLKQSHLDRLRDWVLDGKAANIFIYTASSPSPPRRSGTPYPCSRRYHCTGDCAGGGFSFACGFRRIRKRSADF